MREVSDATARTIQTVGGTGEQRQFTIGINGYAFRTLVDSLYSDKVGSVIREIIANAVDAHAMMIAKGGKPQAAIKVNLPTMFSKMFSVRDYGPGMDHEFVMGLYSQLFHSEKKATNVATGMFGLGSKSPFSISDQFDVRVWVAHDTDATQVVERVYSAFIDAEGIPTIELKSTHNRARSATVGTGVMISVPVSDARVHEFERALSKQALAFFDKEIDFNRVMSASQVTPIEAANKDIEKISGLLYLIRAKNTARWERGDMYIRQGTAVYPIDRNKINIPHDLKQIIDLFTRQGTQMLFDAPIGTFNVTPSREAVAYDTASTAAISKIVHQGVRDGLQKYETQLKDAKTLREAYVMTANGIVPPDAKGRVSTLGLAEAEAVSDIIETVMSKKLKVPKHSLVKRVVIDTNDGMIGAKMHVASFSNGSAIYSFSTTRRHSFSYPSVVFVINHSVRMWEARVNLWMQQNCPYATDGGSVTVGVLRTHRGAEVATLAKFNPAIIPHVYGEGELPDLTTVAAAGIVAPAKTTRKRYAKDDVYTIEPSRHTTSGLRWSENKVSADTAKAAYYVVRNGAKADNVFGTKAPTTTAKKFIDTADLMAIVKSAKALNLIDDRPIYRVTQSQEAIIAADGWGWTNLIDDLFGHLPKLTTELSKAERAKDVLTSFGSRPNALARQLASAVMVLKKQRAASASATFAWDMVESVTHSDLACLMFGAYLSKSGVYPSVTGDSLATMNTLHDHSKTASETRTFLSLMGTSPTAHTMKDQAVLNQITEQIEEAFPMLSDSAPLDHASVYVCAVLTAGLGPVTKAIGVKEYVEIIKEVRTYLANTMQIAKTNGVLK